MRLSELVSSTWRQNMTVQKSAGDTSSRQNLIFSPILRQASILIVDDEPGIRNFLLKTISKHCACVEAAASTEEAAAKLDQHRFDVVILDNIIPRKTGVEWLVEQRRIGFFGEAILITAFADLETAIDALRAGVVDFLIKPFHSNQILSAIANCLDRTALRRENTLLRHELGTGSNVLRHRQELVGSSAEITLVKEYIAKAANLNSSILIKGETGTGKEVAARMVHARSTRSNRAFVPVTCAAFLDESFSQILFGSLPDIDQSHSHVDGLLMSAEGGTLFLDDVEELPATAQAALVRVIETGRIQPINAIREVPVNLRIISSTSKDLLELVKAGKFRKDLYYRLNVLSVEMPALRERPADIVELSELFVARIAMELHIKAPELTTTIKRKLVNQQWMGNVRELRNHIERGLLSDDLENGLDYATLDNQVEYNTQTMASVERQHILDTLEACGGNRAEAARRLEISRKTIDRKCMFWKI